MNIEEKKEWLKARKDRIKLDFECNGIDCYYCPFLGTLCVTDKEVHDLFEEVWAEAHGYVKKEKVKLEKVTIDPSKVGPTITVKNATDKQLNPDHYKAGKLQTIEQMLIMFGIDEVTAFCKLNAYKYQARAGLKGDAVMDHKKADWYMRLYKEIRYCNNITSGLNRMKDFLKEEEKENAADH